MVISYNYIFKLNLPYELSLLIIIKLIWLQLKRITCVVINLNSKDNSITINSITIKKVMCVSLR